MAKHTRLIIFYFLNGETEVYQVGEEKCTNIMKFPELTYIKVRISFAPDMAKEYVGIPFVFVESFEPNDK